MGKIVFQIHQNYEIVKHARLQKVLVLQIIVIIKIDKNSAVSEKY